MCDTRQVALEQVGPRLYLARLPFAAKDRAKSELGCKWDGDRKQWWVGLAKRAAAESLVAAINAADSGSGVGSGRTEGERDDARVYAKVEYKGRTYYQTAATKDGVKYRLATLDGKVAFWAAVSECKVVKVYQSRQVWDGRRYSGRTETVYQTLGGLREFVGRAKQDRASGPELCAECGRSGDLIVDLEDGQLKHYRCCDIPS